MPSKDLLTKKQEQQVIEAIQEAEKRTSGEIRIHIEQSSDQEPLQRAAYIFHELGMDQTTLQNGVLIYIADEDHQAAIYAGKGIHEQVEDDYWSTILDQLIAHFKKQEFEQGIEETVRRVGQKLADLFPPDGRATNELSDEISYT
ncbi:TPM domain-containing protein [Fodinibius salsisoli]|uniref:TPM domain-containing protein n=1 Tax=Fodinibius salsisoli TaxID=2820877 RepID=A0ABT3PJ49_9BACT|nr:TPM domain-containing protein [Fodinibius salsisoli]MCW9705963.1 TPM domain-containing protein [Fodinibius salsisoli]